MLRVEGLVKHYRLHASWLAGHELVKAVDGLDFTINAGESVGIVGESGSGKSTLAKLIMMLEKPTHGQIYWGNAEVTALSNQQRRELRQEIQIVFQDTYASLNPRYSVQEALTEPLANFSLLDKVAILPCLRQILELVKLPASMLLRYPSELSGGERQRVCIARALILEPKFIIFDEATSGLDVTLQSEILKMLKELRQVKGLTYLFITHNLKLIPYITERALVMYQGKIVETLTSNRLTQAVHPYTRLLLSSVPISHPKERRRT